MTLTDPIADMLTRIRNATRARHNQVTIMPVSKMKLEIARIMKEENFIEDYEYIKDGRGGKIVVTLKYTPDKESVILGLKRISKPGRRIYVNKEEIPKVRGGLGIAILSTSRGILTDRRARRLGVGGEILCYIW